MSVSVAVCTWGRLQLFDVGVDVPDIGVCRGGRKNTEHGEAESIIPRLLYWYPVVEFHLTDFPPFIICYTRIIEFPSV